jgi:23S rRNA (guanosine2251-2'-O)-methyltransferase
LGKIVSSDLIYGLHSIAEALKNPMRGNFSLYATEDSLKDLVKKGALSNDWKEKVDIQVMTSHQVQQAGEDLCKEFDFKYSRVPSHLFLVSDSLSFEDPGCFQSNNIDKYFPVLALDQVTDVHNLAAISRTAVFFGVKTILFSRRDLKSFPPSFFRIASGASEHLNMVNCSSLPRTLGKLQGSGITCVGLSEHEEKALDLDIASIEKLCVVLGAEDEGLSNAVGRILEHKVALKSRGPIKSLNVSVAAAVALEKIFGDT